MTEVVAMGKMDHEIQAVGIQADLQGRPGGRHAIYSVPLVIFASRFASQTLTVEVTKLLSS